MYIFSLDCYPLMANLVLHNRASVNPKVLKCIYFTECKLPKVNLKMKITLFKLHLKVCFTSLFKAGKSVKSVPHSFLIGH